jgi:hypothetical protein
MKAFWTTPLLLLASTVVKAQDIPPLAPLRGDAASLADTMKFIQEKLPRTVNYMLYVHDNIAGTDLPPVRVTSILTQVSADAARCSISYHSTFAVNINSVHEQDGEILLKQVRGISLVQADAMQQRAKAQSGHPELNVKGDPPITLVVVTSAPNSGGSKAIGVLGGGFGFYDDSLADRVSKALQHAVSLCGGGKPETF